MFCSQCGARNTDAANYCHQCGQSLVGNSGKNASRQVSASRSPVYEKVKRGIGGWLLFFCIYLVFISPLAKLATAFLESGIAKHSTSQAIQAAVDFEIFSLVVLSISSVAVGYQMWTVEIGALKNAKIYLISCMAYNALLPVVFSVIADLPLTYADGVLKTGFYNAVLSIIFYAGCLYYLSSSKRVRATYPTPETHVHCPDCRNLIPNDSKECEYCGCKLVPGFNNN